MGQLNLALGALLDALKAFFRPRLLLPLLVFAVAQTLVLLLLSNFHLKPLVGWMSPLMIAIRGELAVHYPSLFLVLPSLFNIGNLVLATTLGAYIWGVAILTLVRYFEKKEDQPWRHAARRYGQLFVGQLPLVIAALLIMFGVREILMDVELKGNALRALNWIIMPGINVLVESLFLVVPLAILLEDRPAFSASGRSVSFFRRNALAILLVVWIPSLFHLPFGLVYRRGQVLADRFAPETVAVVNEAQILLFIFTNFLVVAAGTLVFLARKGES